MPGYVLEGPKWSSSTITWSFAPAGNGFTHAISGAYQNTIRAAFARWAQVANVTFKEVPDNQSVNIRLGWGRLTGTELGETAFSYARGTSQTTLFWPGTTIRLEDPAARPVGTNPSDYYQGTVTNLFQLALHEIGHALGLAHSTSVTSVMYPSLGPSDADVSLSDIQGIQALYGAAPGSAAVIASLTSAPTTTITPTVSASIVPAAVNAGTGMIAVYRFFDSKSGTQFLTASADERNAVRSSRSDLAYEGVGLGGIAPGTDNSAVPVYRFFDTKTGTHFFTSNATEKNSLVSSRADLVLEQASFCEHAAAQTGDVPVYRFFNSGDGTHFYTASSTERATVAATRPDMAFEGVAFYAPTVTG